MGKPHGEKFFVIEDNQMIWEKYFNGIMDEWNTENRESLEALTYTDEEKEKYSKKISGNISPKNITPYKYAHYNKRMSVSQYKPVLLELEKSVGKSFDDITIIDIENFSKITTKEPKLKHLNAFLLKGIQQGIIKNNDKALLINLLPEGYRGIGQKLISLEDEHNNSLKKGMMKCPFCGEMKEALADNWLLIQKEGYEQKYLACRECEGRDGEYNY